MISARKLSTLSSLRCGFTLATALGFIGIACSPDFSKLTRAEVSAGGSDGSIAGAGDDCSDAGECGGDTSASVAGGGSPASGAGRGGAGRGGAGGGSAGRLSAGQGGAAATEAGGAGGEAGDSSVTITAGSGGAVAPPNIIDLPGIASADSEEVYKGNIAPAGHDGNPATRWVAANGLPGHYWTLDLGDKHLLSRVEVLWEYPYGLTIPASYKYTVTVSDDNITYSMAIDKTANEEVTQLQAAEFPADTKGRFVRITVTTLPPLNGPGQDYWASFFEARIFGAENPG